MIEERLCIGLVVERSRIESEWAGLEGSPHAWRPVVVFAVPPDVAPWMPLGSTPRSARFYAGTQEIALYSTETANYRDNLERERPLLWVVMRPDARAEPHSDGTRVEIVAVTADPSEGESYTEAGSNIVETVEMPAEVAGDIAAFVAAHHVERPMIKRKRDRALSDAPRGPGRRGPGDRGGDR